MNNYRLPLRKEPQSGMCRCKILLAVFAISLVSLFPTLASAQVFDISDFDVEMVVNTDASIDVTETITVVFHEERHGIFRDIPFRYDVRESDTPAENHPAAGSTYEIKIKDLNVVGHEFIVSDELGNKHIRIGSADKWVNGEVVYIIQYKVYGALSFFENHIELYWNVNGNKTTENTLSCSVNVTFPNGVVIGPDDWQAYRGAFGEKNTNVGVTANGNKFHAKTNSTLAPYEGLTFAVKFDRSFIPSYEMPLDILADAYLIKRFHADIELMDNGVLDVTETYFVEYTGESQNHFNRFFASKRAKADGYDSDHMLEYEIIDARDGKSESDRVEYTYSRESGNRFLDLPYSGHGYETDEMYVLHYRVWGAYDQQGSPNEITYDIFGLGFWEPVENATFHFRYPVTQDAPVPTPAIRLNYDTEDSTSLEIEPGLIKGKIDGPIMPWTTAKIRTQLDPDADILVSEFPKRLLADEYYLSRYHVDIEVRDDGSVKYNHAVTVIPVSGFYGLSFDIRKRVWFYNESSTGEPWKGKVPQWNLFGRETQFVISEFEGSNIGYTYEGGDGIWGMLENEDDNYLAPQSFEFSYVMDGTVSLKEGRGKMYWPIFLQFSQPADRATFRIHLPEGSSIDTSALDWQRISGLDPALGPLEISVDGHVIDGSVPGGLYSYERLVGMIEWNCGSSECALPLATQARMFYENNWVLLLPLLFGLPLFILWFIIGRDKPFTRVVQFYPPQGMTSAEAGMLIDNKLHKKDLISLIFYWGDLGYLRIDEYEKRGKKKIRLAKLKSLPKSANDFERTIFNKLFLRRKTVKISSLRKSFYTALNKAMRQLEAHGKKEGFFIWGTRGFGAFLRFFGYAFGLLALVVIFLVVFEMEWEFRGRWDYIIGTSLTAVVFWWFGKRMPRFGRRGYEDFQKLDGFREFIRKADKDRLKKLVDEDPNYFGHTLSFAIVFGMAKGWAEKFGDLMTAPPDWYRYGHRQDFNPALMATMINSNMRTMRSAMTSTPPSRGGSSSSSYSSGGFSSGSIGGSSFSGGGGFSGGGFGGGGVGSW